MTATADTFGSRLRAMRRERGFDSAEALAREFDPPVSWMTVHRWEKDKHTPSISRLRELARILGVDAGDLLDGAA